MSGLQTKAKEDLSDSGRQKPGLPKQPADSTPKAPARDTAAPLSQSQTDFLAALKKITSGPNVDKGLEYDAKVFRDYQVKFAANSSLTLKPDEWQAFNGAASRLFRAAFKQMAKDNPGKYNDLLKDWRAAETKINEATKEVFSSPEGLKLAKVSQYINREKAKEANDALLASIFQKAAAALESEKAKAAGAMSAPVPKDVALSAGMQQRETTPIGGGHSAVRETRRDGSGIFYTTKNGSRVGEVVEGSAAKIEALKHLAQYKGDHGWDVKMEGGRLVVSKGDLGINYEVAGNGDTTLRTADGDIKGVWRSKTAGKHGINYSNSFEGPALTLSRSGIGVVGTFRGSEEQVQALLKASEVIAAGTDHSLHIKDGKLLVYAGPGREWELKPVLQPNGEMKIAIAGQGGGVPQVVDAKDAASALK